MMCSHGHTRTSDERSSYFKYRQYTGIEDEHLLCPMKRITKYHCLSALITQ
jgi:hypothetical protein